MNTPTNPVPNPSSSAEIGARIHAERDRLLLEQNLEQSLMGQRIAPLEAGDDAALDRVEQQINECRDRQNRIQERMDILARRQEEAKQRERESELDHLAQVATRAKEIGERLIRDDYAKHAPALAATLARLEAVETLIADANVKLRNGGRDPVLPANHIRNRPGRSYTETITETVGINDRRHPYYGRANQDINDFDFAIVKSSGERIPMLATITREVERHEVTAWQKPLPEDVSLPGIGPAPEGQGLRDLWNDTIRGKARAGCAELFTEIDRDLHAGNDPKTAAAFAAAVSPRTARQKGDAS